MPWSPPTHRPAHLPSREQAKKQSDRKYNRTKRTGEKFYKTRAWRQFRAWYIKCNPVCVMCKAAGRVTVANVVDHIIPVKNGGALLSEDNVQSLCAACHNRKGAQDRVKYGS